MSTKPVSHKLAYIRLQRTGVHDVNFLQNIDFLLPNTCGKARIKISEYALDKDPRVINSAKLPLVVCQDTRLHRELAIPSLVPENADYNAPLNILTVYCDNITLQKLVI